MSVMNSTMSSSLAAGASEPISIHFNVTSEYLLILPTSIFLVGYVFGPMAWGPLSESYGRKGTMVYSFALLTIFSIASALAPNFAALVVFRLLVGIGGSCAISVVGGICADIWHDPVSRGRSMAVFMAATTFGPILGPIVSGFISVVSWNWPFWIGAIFAGATWPLFWFFPETYGPQILKKRAQRLRKETGDKSILAPLELEKTDLNHIVTVVLSRPLRMICFEPLVLFTCLYLSYACKSPFPLPPPNPNTLFHVKLTKYHFRCYFLHLPPILPYNLLRHLPFQPRRNRPSLPAHRPRRLHISTHVPLVGLHPPARPENRAALGVERRDAPPASSLRRGPILRNQQFLARLDSKRKRALDCAHISWNIVWHGIFVSVHGAAELSCRCV